MLNKKSKFHPPRNLILLDDVGTQKIQLSNMVSSGEKKYNFFLGCKDDDHEIKPLGIMLPKTEAYVKCCDGETKWMHIFIENDELYSKSLTIYLGRVAVFLLIS